MINFVIFIIFLIIVLLLYKLFSNSKVNVVITIFTTFLIFYIIYNPKLCINSTLKGVKIFFNSVFAPLFIFLILTNIIIEFNGIDTYSKIFGRIICIPFQLPRECSLPIIISMICGYPLGAKYTCELYSKKIINKNTCEKLLNIASNPSPIFLITTIGITMLHNATLGYILLFSNYFSCLVMGLLIKNNFSPKYIYKSHNDIIKQNNIGKAIKTSVDNAIYTSLSIGSFITLFVVITAIIQNIKLFNILINSLSFIIKISPSIISSFLLGLLEMTNGCYIISNVTNNIIIQIILISFFTSFSGLSITLQVYSFTYKYHLCIQKYILRKILQGIICACISIILFKVFFNKITISTFNYPNQFYQIKYIQYYVIILLILTIPFIINKLKGLLHIS